MEYICFTLFQILSCQRHLAERDAKLRMELAANLQVEYQFLPSGSDFALGLNANFLSSGQVCTLTIEYRILCLGSLGTSMNIASVSSIPDCPQTQSRVDGIGWILMQTISNIFSFHTNICARIHLSGMLGWTSQRFQCSQCEFSSTTITDLFLSTEVTWEGVIVSSFPKGCVKNNVC